MFTLVKNKKLVGFILVQNLKLNLQYIELKNGVEIYI
jgi:hypothetical protein